MTRPETRFLRAPIPDPVVEQIAHRLRLLAVPLRIRLLEYLQRCGPTPVQILADELGVQQQSMSKSLMRLYDNGLLERRSAGRQVWYVLVDPSVLAVYEQAARGLAHEASRAAVGPMPEAELDLRGK